MLNNKTTLFQAFGDYSPRYIVSDGEYLSCAHESISILFEAFVHQGFKGYIKDITARGVYIGISKDQDAWDINSLKKLLLANITPGLRLALPVNSQFYTLASVKWSKWVGELSRGILCPGRGNMYSPFFVEEGRITTSNLDRLIEWTFENRDNKENTIDEIRSSYCEFIQMIDDAMQGHPEWTNVRSRPFRSVT